MTNEVIVIGAGGHARVVAEALRTAGAHILAFADIEPSRVGASLDGAPVMVESEALRAYRSDRIWLVNGVGSIGSTARRREVHERLSGAGWRFATVIHARAIVSTLARVDAGAQIMAGAVLQPGATIGIGSIINTGALVDHDCRIGAHCHVAPGAVLSGGVSVGDGSHIGTGAVVIQDTNLGPATLVGAGAVVVRDHPGGAQLIGIPARERERA